jgi:raffinose/stachyose/melibiose transport system substrate-binding protein
MSKLLCVLLSIAMLCALAAGCGGEQNDTQGGDEVTLVIWCQSTNQAAYLQWVKQEFESRYEGIELKIEPQANTVLGEALEVTLASDDAPDIVATWGGMVAGKLFKGGQIIEISDIITPEVEATLVDAVAPNKADGDGKYVGLPIGGFASPVIYYNKTAFDKMGISAPATYEELKTLSQTIRGASKQPMIAGFSTWHLPHFMQEIHARTMTPENFNKLVGTPTDCNPYELPGYKEGFDLLKKYNDDGIFADNITGYDANMAQMEFIAQNAMMLVSPSLDLATLVDACDFELGAFLLPAGEVDAPLASGVYSDIFAINANSEHIEECKKFFTFLLSPEAQAKQLEYEMMPIIEGTDTSGASEIMAGVLAAISEKGMSGFYQSYSVSGVDVQLVEVGTSLLTGRMDAAQAAAKIAQYYKTNILDK